MSQDKFDIRGIPEVASILKSLNGFRQQKQLLQYAGRKAAKPYVNAARSAVRDKQKTGNLYKSIGTKSARRSSVVIAGPRTGGRYKGFVGPLLEDGTDDRYTKRQTWKGTTYRGSIRATKVFTRAWQSSKAESLRLLVHYVKEGWNKYSLRALK